MVSPLIGLFMDTLADEKDGVIHPNYFVPFFMGNVFLLITFFVILCMDLDLRLPKTTGISGLKVICSNVEIIIFIIIVFILGNCLGFLETFLFVYLKDEMGADMWMLGLTITVGAVVSIPFLFIADKIVIKAGTSNIFVLALFIYGIRNFGYSYITEPWMALPFETLEVITIHFVRVAFLKYIGMVAPKGLLATLNGLVASIHYGFGKGTGGLLGAAIHKLYPSSLSYAFFGFGIGSFAISFIYGFYNLFSGKNIREMVKDPNPLDLQINGTEMSRNGDETMETTEPFLSQQQQK